MCAGFSHGRGWTLEPDTGLWVCSQCGFPSKAVARFINQKNDEPKGQPVTMATNTEFVKFLTDLNKLVSSYLEHVGGDEDGVVSKGRATKSAPAKGKAAAKGDDTIDDNDPQADRRAELEKMRITSLRKLAIERGFEEDDVKDAEKDELIDSILDDEAENPAEPEEDEEGSDEEVDDEAEGDEEDDSYTREDLEAMTLRKLRSVALNEYEGITAADIKGMDQDALVDYLLGDGDEEGDDEEESDDEEDEGYTAEDLDEMSLAELKQVAKEVGVRVRPGMRQPAIKKAILDAQE